MRERIVTEESKLAVLDILADRWPCYASEVGWALYPEGNRWARNNGVRALRILKVLQAEGKVKPWSMKGRTICWAPAEGPSFVDLYSAAVSDDPPLFPENGGELLRAFLAPGAPGRTP